MKEDDNRDAPNSSIRPNSKASAITQNQLAKFRELQRRRLQVKTKAKNKSKSKGKKVDIPSEDVDTQGCVVEQDEMLKDPSAKRDLIGNDSSDVSSSTPCVDTHPALKKKKLHWGLDTKERWERKANM